LQAAWLAQDLRAGLPRLPTAQREQWTPQQLSLERLSAFSVKKGCYPGQEIVARTHFLGKAKRGLVLFESESALEAGVEVKEGDRVVGSIISVADGPTPLALAVLPPDKPSQLHADGVALRETALLNGLQR
jgi:folate-binding protein YgfZ